MVRKDHPAHCRRMIVAIVHTAAMAFRSVEILAHSQANRWNNLIAAQLCYSLMVILSPDSSWPILLVGDIFPEWPNLWAL